MNVMSDLLRSKELAEEYIKHRAGGAMNDGCVLCKAESIKTFIHWKVINNKFPYDLIAATHHMLMPIRHVKEADLTDEEKVELISIKDDYVQQYDYILEATNKTKSIPQHFHLHLIIVKTRDDQQVES